MCNSELQHTNTEAENDKLHETFAAEFDGRALLWTFPGKWAISMGRPLGGFEMHSCCLQSLTGIPRPYMASLTLELHVKLCARHIDAPRTE